MQDQEVFVDVFPRGQVLSSPDFKGRTWREMLVEEPVFDCAIGNVTFGPGARNSWHRHPGGQILLVTQGSGLYQERGKPARHLSMGDVVKILPDVEHWHGAAPESSFSHVSITTNSARGGALWLDPVSDREYDEAAR